MHDMAPHPHALDPHALHPNPHIPTPHIHTAQSPKPRLTQLSGSDAADKVKTKKTYNTGNKKSFFKLVLLNKSL